MPNPRKPVPRTWSRISLLAAFAALFGIAPASRANDSDTHLIAVGQVDGGTGALVNHADTIGAISVTATRLETGHYQISIEKPGLLFINFRNQFLVQITPKSLDGTAIGTQANWATTFGGRHLHVTVRTDNIEDIAYSLDDDPLPADVSFYYAIYVIPTAFPASGESKLLLATGKVADDASLVSGVAVEGISIETERARRVEGDYRVNLRKPGAFAGTGPDDYVVLLSVDGADTGDTVVQGLVETTTADLVSVRLRTDDAQADPSVSLGLVTPEDKAFHFSIFRIPSNPVSFPVQSRLLAAMGHLSPGGDFLEGGHFGGGAVTARRIADGAYEVAIDAPGAFVGRSASSFVLQLQVRGTASSDVYLNGRVESVTADRLVLLINANDLEAFGASEGVPAVLMTGASEWMGIYFFLYDTVANFRADMRVGLRRTPSRHRGDNVYGSALRQNVALRLRGARFRQFFFSLENDGTLTDHLGVAARRPGRALRCLFFRLAGGRQNVTARLAGAGVTEQHLSPGSPVLYQARVKYRRANRQPRQRLNFVATAAGNPAPDRIRALLRKR